MLKGYTRIELTDVKSGKTKVIEKENLVTNAVKEFLTPYCGQYSELIKQDNTGSSDASWKTLVGGMLLFDETIPESVDTFFPSSTAKMVGCANIANESNVGDLYRGSYNATESAYSAENKTLKLVYDFATSQANGTISSICLTHRDGGFGNYGNEKDYSSVSGSMMKLRGDCPHLVSTNGTSEKIPFSASTQYMIAIDVKNQCTYRIVFVDSTHIRLIKRAFPTITVSLLDNTSGTISSTDIVLPSAINENYISYNYDAGYFYIVSASSAYVNNGSTFNVTKIGLNAPNTATQYTVTNNTGLKLFVRYYSSGYPISNACVVGNYVYCIGSSSPGASGATNKAIRINLENSSWENLSNLPNIPYRSIMCLPGGRVLFSFNLGDRSSMFLTSANRYVNTATDVIPETSGNGAIIVPDINSTMYCQVIQQSSSYSRTSIYACTDYLATINNLPTPVVKTAAQTMKITYTLQEVDDE